MLLWFDILLHTYAWQHCLRGEAEAQPHGAGSSAWPWGGEHGLALHCQGLPRESVPAGASHGSWFQTPQSQAAPGQDLQTCLQGLSCLQMSVPFCVPVHQTGQAPGREPQACYMFSCSVMSEIGTAVPEPVSWGPQGVWDWVDLAKSLWGLNNSYKQKKGFFLVTCNITEQLTAPCYMFDCICNVLFAYYSDEVAGKIAQGTIIIQVFDYFPMARMWNIQIPHDILGHRNCQLKINFNGRKGWLLVKVQHLECILRSQGCWKWGWHLPLQYSFSLGFVM